MTYGRDRLIQKLIEMKDGNLQERTQAVDVDEFLKDYWFDFIEMYEDTMNMTGAMVKRLETMKDIFDPELKKMKKLHKLLKQNFDGTLDDVDSSLKNSSENEGR